MVTEVKSTRIVTWEVKPQYKLSVYPDSITWKINVVLKSPPIRGCKIKGG